MSVTAAIYAIAALILAHKVTRWMSGRKPPVFGKDWL